jgi:amino acid adenylation domain-containing protein
VGVFLGSSPEAVIALLAIFKAGGAFVPLDPAEPQARIQYMISHARVSVVVTAAELQTALPKDHIAAVEVVRSGGARSADDQSESAARDIDGAACVLYTSGSSGFPKGVVRTHRGIVSRLAWAPTGAGEVYCQHMPLGAGFSQERLFLPLMAGLPLVMTAEGSNDIEQIVSMCEAHSVTNMTLVPASLRRMMDLGPSLRTRLRTVRTVQSGGAALTWDLVQSFWSLLPHATLINAYGSTEAGSVLRGPITGGSSSEPLTIGRPVANCRIWILDEALQPVPTGQEGELVIAAPSLAREYLCDPQRTAEKFVQDPCVTAGAGRLYRSGDRARMLANGEIQFLGRRDRQVKVRGYAVELAEVEAALERHDDIREAAVTAHATGSDHRLRAYVATRSAQPLSVSELRRHLQTSLPDYMIPHDYMVVAQLPRTAGGKVDVTALPAPHASRPILDSVHQPPRDSLESALVEVWEAALEIRGIGIYDDFLELGGDSLSAARVVLDVMERFEIELSLDALLERGTIAAIVAEYFPGQRDA